MTNDFNVDAKRSAADSIRGYVYQAYQSVSAWMQLHEGEILILEGAEDFDIFEDEQVRTTQVKDVTRNLTLRSDSAIDAMSNFWAHQERNSDYHITFHFLTTARVGTEHDAPSLRGTPGIRCWQMARTDDARLDSLRDFLITLPLAKELKEFLSTAMKEEIRQKLVLPLHWDTDRRDSEGLIRDLYSKLVVHGRKQNISAFHSKGALPHLLKHILDCLSSSKKNELTQSSFIEAFDDATRESVPRSELERLRATQDILFGHQRQSAKSAVLREPVPLVMGATSRDGLISQLSAELLARGTINLFGSSGIGKTNVAKLLSDQVGKSWLWLRCRGIEPSHLVEKLAQAHSEINGRNRRPLVVIDDLDLSHAHKIEQELVAFAFSVRSLDGLIVITGPRRCPPTLLAKLWLDDSCNFQIPYFSHEETSELIRIHGLEDIELRTAWTKIIQLTTTGHPQLVHARVLALKSQAWPRPSSEDLIKPQGVELIQDEARQRLVLEVAAEQTRSLLYRLTLIPGFFTRQIALAVSSITEPIDLPGERFDSLIGPWIERETDDRYRVSPLLISSGNRTLDVDECRRVHAAVATAILIRGQINQWEVSEALSHSFLANSVELLTSLAYKISTIPVEGHAALYDSLFWFTVMALAPGQYLCRDAPGTEYYLRIAQYQLAVNSSDRNTPTKVRARLFDSIKSFLPTESVSEADAAKVRDTSELFAIMTCLNGIEIPLASAEVIHLIDRLITLESEGRVDQDILKPFSNIDDIGILKGANRAQILFSMQGVRVSGLEDLMGMMEALDRLKPERRADLLRVCDTDLDFASIAINRAWWMETTTGTLKVDEALKSLEEVAQKGRNWNAPKITKIAIIATSVIADEYGNDPTQALRIVAQYVKEFGNDAIIRNQRAKIFFSQREFDAALKEFRDLFADPSGLASIELVHSFRNAGASASNIQDHKLAATYFRQGAEESKKTNVMATMTAGLIADSAMEEWKLGNVANALLLFSSALEELEQIPIDSSPDNRHVHIAIPHCIVCALNTLDDGGDTSSIMPIGLCSGPAQEEKLKERKILGMMPVWALLTGGESYLGFSLGIWEKFKARFGQNLPLSIAIQNRRLAVLGAWRKRDFEVVIPRVVELYEGLAYARDGRGNTLSWDAVEIPSLKREERTDGIFANMVHLYVLMTALVMTAECPEQQLPIVAWRKQLEIVGLRGPDTLSLLGVLNGSRIPTNIFYEQVANAIARLRSGSIAVRDLWGAFFILLNAFAAKYAGIEAEVEKLAVERWSAAINEQRFAFSNPSVNCDQISEILNSKTLSGFRLIASVLESSYAALRISLDEEALKMIQSIRHDGILPIHK